ncbi:MAG: hypothetical protein ABR962_03945 [Candidatus Bathyarchaeia archaeon]|jgi:heme/copper-type cytochrome/quinol oxidase subunit 2
MKIPKSAFFITLILACLTFSAMMISPTKAEIINASPPGNTPLLYLGIGVVIGAIAVFILLTIYFSQRNKRSPYNKMRERNLVKILCIVLPFVLGHAITYATGVLNLNPVGPVKGYGYGYGLPFTWLYRESVFYVSGVDFAGFLVDFLLWSAILAAAFWFGYYIDSESNKLHDNS